MLESLLCVLRRLGSNPVSYTLLLLFLKLYHFTWNANRPSRRAGLSASAELLVITCVSIFYLQYSLWCDCNTSLFCLSEFITYWRHDLSISNIPQWMLNERYITLNWHTHIASCWISITGPPTFTQSSRMFNIFASLCCQYENQRPKCHMYKHTDESSYSPRSVECCRSNSRLPWRWKGVKQTAAHLPAHKSSSSRMIEPRPRPPPADLLLYWSSAVSHWIQFRTSVQQFSLAANDANELSRTITSRKHRLIRYGTSFLYLSAHFLRQRNLPVNLLDTQH